MPFWRKTQARELDHREASPASIGKWELKHATRTRKTWALISSFLFLITVVFLILVEVGMTSEEYAFCPSPTNRSFSIILNIR